MNRIYLVLFGFILLAVFSYYGANMIYKYSEKNSDDKVIYKEYSAYVPEGKSIETGSVKTHTGAKSNILTYVIGKPEQDRYSYEYYIKDYDSHIAIFNKQGSLYEYTGIVLNSLDENTRDNVKKGIYFKEIEDLFAFLESYSS